MLVGAHLSVSSGYPATVEYAIETGCECMQVFGKSPRQWKGKALDPEATAAFVELRAQAGLGPLFTHTAYLINLATDAEPIRTRSIEALADEMVRGRLLGAAGVVLHIGHDPHDDSAAAAVRVAAGIVEAFEACGCSHPDTKLLLENTATRGFGSCMDDFAAVFAALPAEIRTLVGVCFDTCHGFAAGIEIGSSAAWEALVDDIEHACGPGSLGLIHANDCKFELGSHRDRHEWIGKGFLKDEAFEAMLCVDRLKSVCAVTEMPGDIPDKDVVNIARLKELRKECCR